MLGKVKIICELFHFFNDKVEEHYRRRKKNMVALQIAFIFEIGQETAKGRGPHCCVTCWCSTIHAFLCAVVLGVSPWFI